MSEQADSALSFRFQQIERRLARIEDLEPAVMKQEINSVKEDLRDIAKDLKGFRSEFAREAASVRSLLTKFFIAMCLTLVSGIIYVLISTKK